MNITPFALNFHGKKHGTCPLQIKVYASTVASDRQLNCDYWNSSTDLTDNFPFYVIKMCNSNHMNERYSHFSYISHNTINRVFIWLIFYLAGH